MFLFILVFLINLILTPVHFLKKYFISLNDREYEYISSSEDENLSTDIDDNTDRDNQEHLKDD